MSVQREITQWPKISIITPSYNQGQFIEDTILSIADQGYPNLEFIVIDGGSTDETVDILHAYTDKISHWVSERDNGQSHAINKGAQHATGDIIQWINSDDLLLPGSLETVAKAFIEDQNIEMVAGKAIKFGEGREERTVPRKKEYEDFEEFLFEAWYMQPACFFRGDVFKQLMPLNEALNSTMDTDMFVRYFLLSGNDRIKHIETPLLRFRMHDDSKTFSSQLMFYSERIQIDLNTLRSCDITPPKELGNLVEKTLNLPNYRVSKQVNTARLKAAFHRKWGAWIEDPSRRFREVADHAGLHGDKQTMRTYSWKAIQARPWKFLNWRYWLHTFKR
ncbi:MAG: glycosyltransferase family 2 protein [Cryomorphaceae bacterium]